MGQRYTITLSGINCLTKMSIWEDGALLDHIWFAMLILSVAVSAATGRLGELSSAAAEGADKAVKLIISMAGVMCMWTGLLKIAEKSGVTALMARLLSPVLSFLMPECEKGSEAMKAVSANVSANILGLGNAATPLGIKAMQEMQKHNQLKDSPDNSMVMFVVLNTASLQLVPSTIAALRQSAGSSQPFGVMPYIWIASGLSLLTGIFLAKLFSVFGRKKTHGEKQPIVKRR